ncbi:hypothetical protein LLG90_24115 [Aromatoleum toluclasticum]|uniref:hypothetical protein n=1 Tax=Aromatoleum toluclasticum TaxID=92003 RepID=UPI001D18394B|nr:hypothetical protein [Aromatoleum toluclasticum]MCC4118447.1 hypothetical protein [Aromatoleum toluclasticum]
MRDELSVLLCRRYPRLYTQVREGVPTGAPAENWCFDCADGWFDLIDALSEVVIQYVDVTDQLEVQASDVKEKHNELSFNVHGGDDYIDGAIWMAEIMSAVVCQICGTIDCTAHGRLPGLSPPKTVRFPDVHRPAWRRLVQALDVAVNLLISRGAPEIVVEAVREGESLRFSWSGGNDEIAGCFSLVEAFSQRLGKEAP